MLVKVDYYVRCAFAIFYFYKKIRPCRVATLARDGSIIRGTTLIPAPVSVPSADPPISAGSHSPRNVRARHSLLM